MKKVDTAFRGGNTLILPCDFSGIRSSFNCILGGERAAIAPDSEERKGITMKLTCALTRLPNGQWSARHNGKALGRVEVTAASREDVLSKLRDELQYRIEWCPCSGVSGDTVELEVSEESSRQK